MPLPKPTAAALDALEQALPDDPRVVQKKMFGMPAVFVNGNMFVGVFEDGVTLRLPADRLSALREEDGVTDFEPMEGRPWKEYAHVSATRWGGSRELQAWTRAALDHTAALPPKKNK
jgi:TfoX/Sxy family transcriptional regulator of competence genes